MVVGRVGDVVLEGRFWLWLELGLEAGRGGQGWALESDFGYSNTFLPKQKKNGSPTGNRTPAACVTGRNTDHYTMEDLLFPRA